MNNNKPEPELAVSSDGETVIKLLESLISEARAGRLVAVGVVQVITPGNFSVAGTLNLPLELCVGAEMLHDQYKGVLLHKAAEAAQAQQSRIVKPPPGFKL